MGSRERRRGSRGEYQVRDLINAEASARSLAVGAYRVERSGAGREKGDIGGVPGAHIEVKYCEQMSWWGWWAQATRDCPPGMRPYVIARRNRSPWLISTPAAGTPWETYWQHAGDPVFRPYSVNRHLKGQVKPEAAFAAWSDAVDWANAQHPLEALEPVIIMSEPYEPGWVIRALEPAGMDWLLGARPDPNQLSLLEAS